MDIPPFSVPDSIAEARRIQDQLRHKIKVVNKFNPLNYIAGVDVGYDTAHDLAHASIVVMSVAALKPIEAVQSVVPVTFPYVPGLLSFREIPAILKALEQLKHPFDLLMVDGQGIAHPRRLGIAAHLGVLLDMPSIGVAKSKLIGDYSPPGLKKGDISTLMIGDEHIGTVLRSRDNVNPLFISPGHRVDIPTSLEIALRCLGRYRLPEPTRIADKLSKYKEKNILL